jgi:membrane peptidoglycan carboxypeptidase
MNPTYDDSSNAGYSPSGSSGRARVPGSSDEPLWPEAGSPASSGWSSSNGDAPSGRASVGGSSGRATVSGSSGRATVSGSSGRASVGDSSGNGSSGRGSDGYGSVGSSSGRASVRSAGGYQDNDYDYPDSPGTGSISGRATVGRAAVGGAAVGGAAAGRASVGRARVGGPDDYDYDDGPGGGGPGGRGPGGSGGDDDESGPPSKKRNRVRNWILSGVAVFIMLSGLVVVFGAYQFNHIPDPEAFNPPQATTIYYSDGHTPMAKFGGEGRTLVTLDQVSKWVPQAVVATEDNSFYTNSGVSFRGIARAAINNLKGGDTQGGSTISQQYMRQTLTDDPSKRTVKVKIQEALGAIKLDEKFSKDKIMEMYLNVVFFGRGAYGIEAAAQAYFNKPAKDLTLEESMVLAGVIKDPGGAFDPTKHLDAAKDRWNYTRKNLVKIKAITQAQADALKYPTNVTPADSPKNQAEFGKDQPTGLVVHHVMDELVHMKDAKGNPRFPDLEHGGYQITTTINKGLEDEAIAFASVNGSKSEIKKMAVDPAIVQAGVVSIDPNTGEVLAYYGGDKGSGYDYAGIYRDPILQKNPDGSDDDSWSGGSHSPGSSMKIYTLAAALKQGYAIDSYWDGSYERSFPGRTTKVHNASKSENYPDGVSLTFGLQMSLNTVYYAVGSKVGAAAVIDMAHAMGINHIWYDQVAPPKRIDMNTMQGDIGKQVNQEGIGTEVSIGNFPITVQDQANGVATIAAGGVYRPAHFVKSATGPNGFKYAAPTPAYSLADEKVLTTQQTNDLRYAMSQVLAPGAGNGYSALRPNGWSGVGGKSGTWETNENSSHNADGWFVGFTPKLATAVWVGNSNDAHGRKDIYVKNGSGKKDLAGANIPGAIFKDVMTAGLHVVGQTKNIDIPKPGSFTGDSTKGEKQSPAPTAPPTDNNNCNPFQQQGQCNNGPGPGPGPGQGGTPTTGPTNVNPFPSSSRKNG